MSITPDQHRSEFDSSRLANVGRLAAKDYARFRKTADKLLLLVTEAQDAGLSSAQIETVMFSMCGTREELDDVYATFMAVSQAKGGADVP